MGSALPKVDDSVDWPRCRTCDTTHQAAARCPRRGVWLIAGTRIDQPYRLRILPTGARVGS